MLSKLNIFVARTASGAPFDHAFLYQHTMRFEWGYGAVTESHEDRTTFKFDDGVVRTIKHGHLHLMRRVDLEEPEASEVRKRIARPTKSATALSKAGAKKRVAKPKAVAAVESSLEGSGQA